jgi:hypothetical protein
MAKLNEGSDILPGVTHANIATKFDEVVTPWGNCYQKGQGAVNKLLQDFCGISINEHCKFQPWFLSCRVVIIIFFLLT